jgi:hypothetical protein
VEEKNVFPRLAKSRRVKITEINFIDDYGFIGEKKLSNGATTSGARDFCTRAVVASGEQTLTRPQQQQLQR